MKEKRVRGKRQAFGCVDSNQPYAVVENGSVGGSGSERDKGAGKRGGKRERNNDEESEESSASLSSLNEEEEQAGLYIIEKIVDHRGYGSTMELKVRWKRYRSQDDTWELEKNVKRYSAWIVEKYWTRINRIRAKRSRD